MKFFKWLFLLLVFAGISTFILSYLAPLQQQVIKSVVIHAPANKVFQQMMLLQNFNNWSVWGRSDTAIHYTSNHIPDGKIGTTIEWEGNAFLSGKGKIALTGLDSNKQITHHITFIEPQKMEADSKFDLTAQNDNTIVTWTFTVPLKKPWNIYNLFFNLDKEKGSDFERGLQALKLMIEKSPLRDKNAPKINPIQFPATNYVIIKQRVLWADLNSFFTTHFHHLAHYTLKDSAVTFIRTGLFFTRDEKELQSDVAAAISIPAGYKPQLQNPEELVSIPASKAIETNFTGEDAMKDLAYQTLNEYVSDKKLKIKMPIIEEFTMTDKITQTRIIYLIE